MEEPFLNLLFPISLNGFNMPHVVSCVLQHDKKILLLKRSQNVSTYRGYWGVVAGYVEEDEQPLETAFKEIREEVGLSQTDIQLIKQGDVVSTTDVHIGKKYNWDIHPFVFRLLAPEKIHIDWEHDEYKWITPKEISMYTTTPCLEYIVKTLL